MYTHKNKYMHWSHFKNDNTLPMLLMWRMYWSTSPGIFWPPQGNGWLLENVNVTVCALPQRYLFTRVLNTSTFSFWARVSCPCKLAVTKTAYSGTTLIMFKMQFFVHGYPTRAQHSYNIDCEYWHRVNSCDNTAWVHGYHANKPIS